MQTLPNILWIQRFDLAIFEWQVPQNDIADGVELEGLDLIPHQDSQLDVTHAAHHVVEELNDCCFDIKITVDQVLNEILERKFVLSKGKIFDVLNDIQSDL
jgi:hypothetical protein